MGLACIENSIQTYREVVPVEQEFSEKLEGLSPRDIVVRMEQFLIIGEHLVEIRLQEVGREHLMSGK